jgi:hypothetical protein
VLCKEAGIERADEPVYPNRVSARIKEDRIMSRKTIQKFMALALGTTFAALALPGCDAVTQLFQGLLGTVTGA